jgi:histone-lysine N-methyltransferase SETMAR
VKNLEEWVPHELNENQTNRGYEACSALLLRKNKPALDRIVTCDKKWILYDNRRRYSQWLHYNASKHFPKSKLHQKKVMVTVWWSAASVIRYNFLNPGEPITAEKYCREIDKIHRKLREEQPELFNQKGPILLHDKARSHVSQWTIQKMNELS